MRPRERLLTAIVLLGSICLPQLAKADAILSFSTPTFNAGFTSGQIVARIEATPTVTLGASDLQFQLSSFTGDFVGQSITIDSIELPTIVGGTFGTWFGGAPSAGAKSEGDIISLSVGYLSGLDYQVTGSGRDYFVVNFSAPGALTFANPTNSFTIGFTSNGSLGPAVIGDTNGSNIFSSPASAVVSAVPEPSSLLGLGILGAGLLVRRRRAA